MLLLSSTLAHAILLRVVDGARVVPGADGRNTIVQNSQISTAVSVLLFCVAIACAGRALLVKHGGRTRSLFGASMQLLVAWWTILTVLLPRTPGGIRMKDLVILGAPLVVLAVVSDPPTVRTVESVNRIRDSFAAANIAYAFLFPELGQSECREDKCGILGSLFTGFFTQENTAPALISMLVPLSAASRTGRQLTLSAALALSVALVSGSRTGLATSIVGICAALYVRKSTDKARGSLDIKDAITAIPLVATLGSLALFLTADPDAFTGRGRVYAGIQEALTGAQAWYGIPWNTVLKATDGYLAADHGQAPHLLARAGIIGLALWCLSMMALLLYQRFSHLQALGLAILIAGSVTMFTESAFELDARSTGFFGLMLATGLLCSPGASDVGTIKVSPRSKQHKAATAAVASFFGILALAVLLVSPPVYRASSTMSYSPAPADPRQARDGLSAAQVKAESFAHLVRSERVIRSAQSQSGTKMSADEIRSVIHTSRRELATVITVSFDGASPEEAQRVNDSLMGELVRLARELERRPGNQAQMYPVSLGTSKTYRVSPIRANGTAASIILALGATLTWATWRHPRFDSSSKGSESTQISLTGS